MKSFKFPRKYYLDRQIYKRGSVDIETGPTVLIGCNGSRKTTMLHIIKEKLKSEEIPLIFFDNLSDGGSTSLNKALFNNNLEMLANMAISSEGELININGTQEIGTFYNDEFCGWNILVNNNGLIYIGLFNKNNLNGKGLNLNPSTISSISNQKIKNKSFIDKIYEYG